MDLHDLTPVLTAEGPFVTVHLASESDVEQAADRYELAWKDVLRELAGRGVDDATLDALAGAKGSHADGQSRLVVATTSDAQVQLAVSLPERPRRPVADVAPLPHLLPLVDDLMTKVPHVVVVADRSGADVTAYVEADQPADEQTVKPSPTIFRNVKAGSWTHIQHEFPAERGWMASVARDVVATVTELAERVRAELVIGVGDQRELAWIKAELPVALTPKWVEVAGGRSADGGGELVHERVRDVLSRHVVSKSLDLLADYAQERGQHKRACDGVEDVVAALRKAQVQTLLVTTAADQDATLWFGPDPATLAMSEQELRDLGVEHPVQGPLVDVLLRAALGTGADVELVAHQLDQAPHGGVGALLRYADSDTASARA